MAEHARRTSGVNPHVSVDCVIFGFDFKELKVLLIRRRETEDIEEGRWALPGDLIYEDESLDEAASRVLNELTGLHDLFLEQFEAFGDPDRVKHEGDAAWLHFMREQPEARVITVAYYSLVKLVGFQLHPASFAKRAEWFSIEDVPGLAFDHNLIVERAMLRLRDSLRRQPIGFALLPPKFTLGQLQRLYEAILGESLDKRNFRKKMLKKGVLIPLDEKQKGVPHKPAQFYKFDHDRYAALSGDFDFGGILS